jgi:bifunctional non-homologous end joining protein LigD
LPTKIRENVEELFRDFPDTGGMPRLEEYKRKRNFGVTSEPAGDAAGHPAKPSREFVIQKHAATRLHYDLRLEMDGVLKSWAVPKGPSLDPGVKRLAIQVEDHPFAYRKFEGRIPQGQYGGGDVIVWDRGTYTVDGTLSGQAQLAKGDLKFTLQGEKLRGSFVLVKIRRGEKQNEWLLIKHRDQFADAVWNIDEHGESVVSGRPVNTSKEPPGKVAPRGEKAVFAKSEKSRSKLGVGEIAGAQKAAMPKKVPVTLARLAEKPFSNPDWIFEVKWDGVRTVAFIEKGRVMLQARSGRDVTREYPEFQELAERVRAATAILDGEIVAPDPDGRSNFQRLQDRIGVENPSAKLLEATPTVYYAFDLLYCDGYDLRKATLRDRKNLLNEILHTDELVRYSSHVEEKGEELFAVAKQKLLEGIVAKDARSPYPGNRTSQWLKFKIVNELDAVVGGWTAPRRSRKYFGALVVGLYNGKHLQAIGSVGTGFDEEQQRTIFEKLQTLRADQSPFHPVPRLAEAVEWVKPVLVARVKFANWTDGANLRAPVFLSMRNDRQAKSVTFASEKPALADELKAQATKIKSPAGADAAANETATEKQSSLSKWAAMRASSRKANPALPKASVPLGKPIPARGDNSGAEIAQRIRAEARQDLTLDIDGKSVHFTHLDKVYFPESGITKRDLLSYYSEMADYILPFLAGRPLVLRRYPNGITGTTFFQKEAPAGIPEWLKTARVFSDERGGEMRYVMAEDRAALLYLTNLGCIDHNPWSSRADAQDTPDYVFFDLDPTPDTSFKTVLQVAAEIVQVLQAIRMKCYLKTSGASGFHIFIPLRAEYTYEQTRTFAEVVGRVAAARLPKITTFERSVRRRPKGTVLIDALQNARGKPLAAAYSVRAFPKAPVSTPLSADELNITADPAVWNVRSIAARLKKKGDLWVDFWQNRQDLAVGLARLEKFVRETP